MGQINSIVAKQKSYQLKIRLQIVSGEIWC